MGKSAAKSDLKCELEKMLAKMKQKNWGEHESVKSCAARKLSTDGKIECKSRSKVRVQGLFLVKGTLTAWLLGAGSGKKRGEKRFKVQKLGRRRGGRFEREVRKT